MLQNKVFRNASWIIAGKIAQSVLNLVITMLTARYLGPSNYGLVSYAASIVAFAVPIMQLGLNNTLVQETVHHPEEEGKLYGTAIFMSACSSLACIVGVISFSLVANAGETDTLIVCALYSLLLFFQALDLIEYWFQAKYLSKYAAVVSLCAYALVSAYKVFLLVTEKSVYWFAVSYALDYLLIALALLIIYRRLGGMRLSLSRTVARRLWEKSRYYILSGLMVTVFLQTDKIMLKLMINEAATGFYTVAVSAAGMTSFVFAAIIDSARPAIFESQGVSEEAFEKNISRLYAVIIWLSLLQSVAMTLLASPIIHLLYGTAYAPSVPVLMLIVWYTTFSYIGPVRDIWLLANGLQRYLWAINGSGALMNVLLNACLIPYFGIMGAAAASLVTQIFTNVILGVILRPLRRNHHLLLRALSPHILLELVRSK